MGQPMKHLMEPMMIGKVKIRKDFLQMLLYARAAAYQYDMGN